MSSVRARRAQRGLLAVESRRAQPAFAPVASPTARRPWDALLVSAALYLAIGVENVQVIFPVVGIMRPGIVVVCCAIAFLAMANDRPRRLQHVLDPVTIAVLALLVWAAVTVPFALHSGMATKAVTDAFSRTVLLYVVLVAAVRTFVDLERLLFVHVAGVSAYCLFALVVTGMQPSGTRMEFGAGAYDANDFATFAVTAAPFGLFFAQRPGSLLMRLVGVAGVGLVTIGVVLSGSRGGFLALLAAGAYVLLRFTSIRLTWRVAGVVVALLAMTLVAGEQYWARMGTILEAQSDYNVTADVGRTQIWKRGIGYALARPISGVGLFNFGWAELTLSPLARRMAQGVGVTALATHNAYIQVLAELGFVGFGLLMVVLVGTIRGMLRSMRALKTRDPAANALGQALMGSLTGLLVGIFFLSHGYSSLLYAHVAFCVAYGKVERLEKKHVPRPTT